MSIFENGKYSQIGGEAKYRKYDLWDAGDQIAGKLVEIRKDKFNKPAYVIKVEDVAFKKKSEQPNAGDLFTLNSAGGLEYKIEQIGGANVGDLIGVEYNGKTTIEKGKWKGKLTHDIDFFISRGESKQSLSVAEDDSSLDLI
jgi:hypothetical protein